MSRFCNKHIQERSEAELREYLSKARFTLKSKDPRSKEGKAALNVVNRTRTEMEKRGLKE